MSLDADELTDDELAELEGFDDAAWLAELDEVIADFIEDVVGGDYE